MAVAKRNLEEIGESLENMGMNDRPSLLNTEMAKSEEDKNKMCIRDSARTFRITAAAGTELAGPYS